MRLAAKIDRNQSEIVDAFRKFGCSVLILSQVGKGCPDILVSKNRSSNILVEIKDGSKTPSKRVLTADQQKFHENWRGPVVQVHDLEDVINLVRAMEQC